MIGVCSFDAGGAELLSSYIKKHPNHYAYCLAGPALAIFQRKLEISSANNLTPEQLIKSSHSLLCSGSWQSELELDAIDLARKHQINSTVFLDHWVNFPERFKRASRESWPDQVWVADEYAYSIAEKTLPSSLPITLLPNPIQTEIEQLAIKNPTIDKGLNILYVSEPTSQHANHSFGDANHFGYSEYEALEYAINILNDLKGINNFRLRCHPAEASSKYDHILANARFPFEKSDTPDLLDDLQGTNIVIGATTMAMAIAIYANKYVFTSLPRPNLNNPLPFKEIKPLNQLSNLLP